MKKCLLCVMLILVTRALGFCEDLTDNLVVDGGMEEWRETSPTDGWWNYLTVSCKGLELAKNEKGNLLTAKVLSQFYECKLMKPEDRDVHGGKRALRLKGQFYLAESSPSAYQTQEGDIYVVHYWAKGEGQSLMHIHVYGDAITQILEVRGKPQKDTWSLIEERIQVVGRAPTTIYPRLWASDELLIDDVFVGRIVREDERKLVEVPADCQERIAFASRATGGITLNGKLEEDSWSKAVRFGGFRFCKDQSLLSPTPTWFKVLYDDQNLYFGLEIPLSNCRQLETELRQDPLKTEEGELRDKTDTYTDRQSIELFLQAPEKSRYCQFVVSLDGYRYDGAGMDGAWNGTWEFGISVADDRWFLEMKIPARDLGVVRVSPAEGWRLNFCSNRRTEVSTWAVVGGDFHNPYAFGKLVAQDFTQWLNERSSLRQAKREEILKASEAAGRSYSDRLPLLDASTALSVGRQSVDWESLTQTYARMDYVDYGYRCVEEELRYARFFW
ncbi:MAG: hypothetical protein HY318_15705 [Armatimonadetes bacterium]|nr:hypothetical protein [Armatimonadota bacterium]